MEQVEDQLLAEAALLSKDIQVVDRRLRELRGQYSILVREIASKYEPGIYQDIHSNSVVEVELISSISSRYKDLLDDLSQFILTRLEPLIQRELSQDPNTVPTIVRDTLLKEISILKTKWIGIKSEPKKDVKFVA